MPTLAASRFASLDRLAIGLSGLCAIHCLGTAVALGLLSSVAGLLEAPIIHEVGLVIAMILGAVALGQGARQHGMLIPVAVGALVPLTLFVLHPLETLSFGALWLAVLAVYTASWLGIAVYLTLNLAFGLIGHLGVEPAPRFFARTPGLRHVATGRFHADHHADAGHNFGFYTLIWDRLFGTLAPENPVESAAVGPVRSDASE